MHVVPLPFHKCTWTFCFCLLYIFHMPKVIFPLNMTFSVYHLFLASNIEQEMHRFGKVLFSQGVFFLDEPTTSNLIYFGHPKLIRPVWNCFHFSMLFLFVKFSIGRTGWKKSSHSVCHDIQQDLQRFVHFL